MNMAAIDAMEMVMGRFSRWARWMRKSTGKPRHIARKSRADDTLPCADDAPPKGCGWFDSSHELMRGLMVIEMPPLSQPLVRIGDRVDAATAPASNAVPMPR